MPKAKLPRKFLKRLGAVTGKRPKTVIAHILKHGFVTTDELQDLYGYTHAPRAARDVREEGIPLETFKVVSAKTGRPIGAYRFADLSKIRSDRIGGRRVFSKQFKRNLLDAYGTRCAVCHGGYGERYLQIDHRVPFEVGGDAVGERVTEEYMLLDGACNRAKSWSCEHCENWLKIRDPNIYHTCYWAQPESYKHVAMRDVRRLDVEWSGGEVIIYDRVKNQAEASNFLMPEYIKSLLKKLVE